MKITNISGMPQYLTAKDGKVHEIAPGDTDTVDIDRDNVNVEAKLNARLIEVEEKSSGAARRSGSASTEGSPPA